MGQYYETDYTNLVHTKGSAPQQAKPWRRQGKEDVPAPSTSSNKLLRMEEWSHGQGTNQSQSRLHQFPLPEEVVELSEEKPAVTKARLQLCPCSTEGGCGFERTGDEAAGPWEGGRGQHGSHTLGAHRPKRLTKSPTEKDPIMPPTEKMATERDHSVVRVPGLMGSSYRYNQVRL